MTALGDKSRELSRTNPWWRATRSWEDHDADLREAAESGLNYYPEVLADLRPSGLYILRGPRRVGKTVTTKQVISSLIRSGVPPLSVVRVAADGWEAKDLRTVVQNVAIPPVQEGQTRYWFMDEVTGVTGDWASQIKWLRDNDTAFREATVILTGSNASQLSLAAGSLAGRRGRADNVDRTLLPMGFRSFAAIWYPEIDELPAIQPHQVHAEAGAAAFTAVLPWLNDLIRLWEVYLQYGGFPVAVAAAKAGQPVPAWFSDALFDVVHRDAFANGSLDAAQTSSLLTRVWASVSTPVNLTSIAEDVGISRPTVARHIQYLRDAYLLWRCPQLDREWIPKDLAQEKLYPIDPIIARLPHLRRASRPDPDPTVMAEAQLGTAMRRAILRDQKSWDADTSIFYLRTATRKEIDFISEEFAGAGIEAKYIDGGNWRREAGTLDASTYRGLLCTRSVLDLSAGSGGTWAVPTALLAALVDS